MAQVKISAVTVACSNCRKRGQQVGKLVCRCGEEMRRYAHAIRWICIACGNSIPMPPCDCYLLYDIEVNGVLARLAYA